MDGIPPVGSYTIDFGRIDIFRCGLNLRHTTRREGDSMKIGIIGAGKVGFTLGKFFSQGGIRITGYYSRNPESARQAAALTHSSFYDTLQPLIKESDAIFITVPDGAITAVYQQVRQYQIPNKYICHCSGALSAADAFPAIGETGAHGFSIHPLFPISSKYEAYRELSGAFFCLEGEAAYLPVFQSLLEGLGCRTQIIPAGAKVRYHAACAMASNLVCALVQQSVDLLVSCGFPPELAADALAPLIRSNVAHLLESGLPDALTGPVERCDTATVEKHLASMPDPGLRELYRLLSLRLIGIAAEKHPHTDYTPMRERLTERRTES